MFCLCLPLFFALMRLVRRKYIYSALVTLSCAGIVLASGWANGGLWLAAGLVLGAAGDWFMAHQQGHPARFLAGVGLFGLGHGLFIVYALCRHTSSLAAGVITVLLSGVYAVYLRRRILPGQVRPMRLALWGYAAVSLLSLYCAVSMSAPAGEGLLYALGIGCLLFSDTMIAEMSFARQRWARYLILPTYYACHVLLAASRLVG